MRRLLYWWNIVNQSENMLSKVYMAQKNKPVKGDWYKLLEEDKKEFGFELTDEKLKELYPKKSKFKNAVKKKAISLTEKFISSKKESHSKLDDIPFKMCFLFRRSQNKST